MARILVADDNAPSRELMREILEAAGYEVMEATNGREALARVAQTRPDLVLLDLAMPALDGYGVIRELRGDPSTHGIRVLAVTAYAMPEDRERAIQAGFDGFLTKPIRGAELARQVGDFFGTRTAARV